MNLIPLPPCKLSPTLEINQQVQQRWANGESVYHLGFGESRMPLFSQLDSALIRNAQQKSYLPSLGLWELRQAVADFHSRHWRIGATPEQVVIGPGSKSLIFAILLALDCHVFLPIPSWVSYAPQASLIGRPTTFVESTAACNYEFSIEALARSLETASTERLRLLIINSPNNPTGNVWSAEFLEELAEFCRRNNVIVLSDEIYAMTIFDRQGHCSISSFYPEGTIVVGGPSKHLSVGGWRLGTAVLPNNSLGSCLLAMLNMIGSEIWSSPTAPIQYAAVAAYSPNTDLENYIQTCTDLHELKTRLLWRSLVRLGIRCTEPKGAFYFVANFDLWKEPLVEFGVQDSANLADFLLDRYQLATLPGTAFGIPATELSLRIASSYLDMETDESARNLMSTFLANEGSLKKADLPNTYRALEKFGEFVGCLG